MCNKIPYRFTLGWSVFWNNLGGAHSNHFTLKFFFKEFLREPGKWSMILGTGMFREGIENSGFICVCGEMA